MKLPVLIHDAVFHVVRPKGYKTPTIRVEFACECGATAVFFVKGCTDEKCQARTHPRGQWNHEHRKCPALFATFRSLDDTMTKDAATEILEGCSC